MVLSNADALHVAGTLLRSNVRKVRREDQCTNVRLPVERHDDDLVDSSPSGGRPQAHCSLGRGGIRLLGDARAPGNSSVALSRGGAWCTQVSTAPL
ncbi:hypothetical protein GCM10010317_055160 [Streptomyces mirabilis]|nr:hypothetical protein GCM10010317_055160 [Streptomyces mirabilis]